MTNRIYKELTGGVWIECHPIDCGAKIEINWRDIFGNPHGVAFDIDEDTARHFAEGMLDAIEDDSTSTERPPTDDVGKDATHDLIKLIHDLDKLRGEENDADFSEIRSAASRAHEFITSGNTLREVRSMTFETFTMRNVARCESPDGFGHKLSRWTLSDWMTATFGELGEAANVAKKLNRVRDGIVGNNENEEELRDKLKREVGDAFIYLDLLARSEGFTIEEAARLSFDSKSKEIGYESD